MVYTLPVLAQWACTIQKLSCRLGDAISKGDQSQPLVRDKMMDVKRHNHWSKEMSIPGSCTSYWWRATERLDEVEKQDRTPKGSSKGLQILPQNHTWHVPRDGEEVNLPHLQKQSTFIRETLQVGYRFLLPSHRHSYSNLQYSFRVEVSTICKFIPEVCKTIIAVYKEEAPPQDWRGVEWSCCQVPNGTTTTVWELWMASILLSKSHQMLDLTTAITKASTARCYLKVSLCGCWGRGWSVGWRNTEQLLLACCLQETELQCLKQNQMVTNQSPITL